MHRLGKRIAPPQRSFLCITNHPLPSYQVYNLNIDTPSHPPAPPRPRRPPRPAGDMLSHTRTHTPSTSRHPTALRPDPSCVPRCPRRINVFEIIIAGFEFPIDAPVGGCGAWAGAGVGVVGHPCAEARSHAVAVRAHAQRRCGVHCGSGRGRWKGCNAMVGRRLQRPDRSV